MGTGDETGHGMPCPYKVILACWRLLCRGETRLALVLLFMLTETGAMRCTNRVPDRPTGSVFDRENSMKVLLLGVGMQGKAALHDLVDHDVEVVAADREVDALREYVESRGYAGITCEQVDAADSASIDRLMATGVDVAVDLLPVPFIPAVTRSALSHGVHLVNTFYPLPEVEALADEAVDRGVTILPEFGMDPGIDLVLLGQAARSLDSVDGIASYGAGFPEPSACDNPLNYKVTWTFEGVLRSYRRAARLIRGGKVVDIGEREMFAAEHIHEIDIDGLGTLEAFPNADALEYADLLGLDAANMREMGRYVLRWPGHAALWKTLVDLGFLEDEPVDTGGKQVHPKEFLAAMLEPQMQYRDDERDVVVVRIDVSGLKGGQPARRVLQVIDRRDLDTGFTAMSRTVGYTASIGAQMIGDGTITKRGLLTPVHDVPFDPFVSALDERGIVVNI
jgi:lysine 6-dehydrogenase